MRSLSVCTAAVAVVANCEDNESNLALYMHIPYCRLLRNSSCTQSLWQSSTMILDLQGDVHSFLGRQYKKMAQTAGQGEARKLCFALA